MMASGTARSSMFQAWPRSMPRFSSCRAKTKVPTIAATAMMRPYQWKAKPANWTMTGSIVMWM